MAIKIKFDPSGNPEVPTLILATRTGDKLGQIANVEDIVVSASFQDPDEITFTVNKYNNNEPLFSDNSTDTGLWSSIKDFKAVWCWEWDQWFQAKVTYTDDQKVTKQVQLTALGEAETGQLILHGYEINTENDIAREDYVPTVFYNPDNPSASLLHRMFKVAPHYTIGHVDDTLVNIQRTFSWEGTTLHDALQEVGEEIGALISFDNGSDPETGRPLRTINFYDLRSYCLDCGFRGEFVDVCPECGSENVNNGYGEDTTICFSTEDIADDITIEGDVDSMKNCFMLQGGDDLMTATIRNCMPDSSGYYWYFTDEMKEDMPDELVAGIEAYEQDYEDILNNHVTTLPPTMLTKWQELIAKYEDKYSVDVDLSNCVGFNNLIQALYEVNDFDMFLRESMMPDSTSIDTSAIIEAAKLTQAELSPTAVPSTDYISGASANSAVLALAKAIVNPNYKVTVNSYTFEGSTWTGSFTVTSYYDETDTATSSTISVLINDDFDTYLTQRMEKVLAEKVIEDHSITSLFSKTLPEFKEEIKAYSFTSLSYLQDACQACMDILIEQGVSDPDHWTVEMGDLYNQLYVPYYEKYTALSAELNTRQEELNILEGTEDEDGVLTYLSSIRNAIQAQLNMENYLSEDLNKMLYIYRRENDYQNTNYISEGLSNAELIQRAQEFINVAKAEIIKASEIQYTLSSNLKNLLVIPEFKPLTDYFEVGNWLRAKVEGKILKFRLLNYEISYSDLTHISVTFSNIITKLGSVNTLQQTLADAASMATSYNATMHQAGSGGSAGRIIDTWFRDGLDMTNMKIVNNADNQDIVYDSHGLTFRKKDELLDQYSPVQLKIINSTLAITDDDWETTKACIGQFYYRDPVTGEYVKAYGVNGEVIVGKLILGESLGLYNEANTMTFNENGLNITNGTNTVVVNPNSDELFVISNDSEDILKVNADGNLELVVSSLSISAGGTTSGVATEDYVDEQLAQGSYRFDMLNSGNTIKNGTGVVTLYAVLYRGANPVTTGVTYSWARFVNGSWVAISNTTDHQAVNASLVDGATTFRCVATYSGISYTAYGTVYDKTDPYTCEIYSSLGMQIKNSNGIGAVYCKVWQNGEEVDPIKTTTFATQSPANPSTGDYYYRLNATNKTATLMKYSGSSWAAAPSSELPTLTYTWSCLDQDGNVITTPASWGTSKVVYIDTSMINEQVTIIVDVE